MPGREEIKEQVLEMVKSLVQDFDSGFEGGITPESRVLLDLDLDSVQIVRLFTRIRKQFGDREIPFQDLLFHGNGPIDFSIRELVDFLHSHMTSGPAE